MPTQLHEAFQMPTWIKISGRVSSVTNAFWNSIIPSVMPTDRELETVFKILELDFVDLRCVYCGDSASEWDHFRPLVKDRLPTGYITEIRNLVPACGKCNQSKGNKNWNVWIVSDAKRSPKSRGVTDLNDRIARIGAFEEWGSVEPLKFEELIPAELWLAHLQNLDDITTAMKTAQSHAGEVRSALLEAIEKASLRN